MNIAPTARALVCALPFVAHAGGAHAQRAPAPAGAGEVRGRLVSATNGRPIDRGAITIVRAEDNAFVSGALPRPDGTFRVDALPAGRYTVRARTLGFAPVVVPGVVISPERLVVELGNVKLAPVRTMLDRQTILAEREGVTLAPDRNSYSTKAMTGVAGGTSVDILRNVPAVEVDGSNKVRLRGSDNVVVQINGRTSPLRGEQLANFLAQLPARAVKAVEVATNPSAKEDPEGTAGIINLVLDQDATPELSGGVTIGTATTKMLNLGGNIGRQAGPLTLFLSANLYRDNRGTSGITTRNNFGGATPSFIEMTSTGLAAPRSVGLTLRSEYKLGTRDAISLDALMSRGVYAGENANHYADLDQERSVIGRFDLYRNQSNASTTQDYVAAFRRTGDARGPAFSTELRFTRATNDNDALLFGQLQQADVTTGPALTQPERDSTVARAPSWALQTDYTHPYGSATKLEAGVKGTLRHSVSEFTASVLDTTTGGFVADVTRATAFDYRERIGAGYAVVSHQSGKLQTQAGLRLETVSTELNLPLSAQQAVERYGSAFPSAIASYNFTEVRQAKLSYSRRVSRPSPYQLSPVEYRESPRVVFRGDPGLRPEYTDALELGFQDIRSWGTVQLTPYLRRTLHAVKYLQTIDSAGVLHNTYANVASAANAGADLNATARRGLLTVFGGAGAYRYSSDASNLASAPSANASVWSARVNVTWAFSPRSDLQAQANYRSAYATEGGAQSAFVYSAVGIRRKLWSEQGSVALRVVDPFNLMVFGSRTVTEQALEFNERRYGTRGIFLSVTRNFGQQLKLRTRQQEPEPQVTPPPGG